MLRGLRVRGGFESGRCRGECGEWLTDGHDEDDGEDDKGNIGAAERREISASHPAGQPRTTYKVNMPA